MFDFHRKSDLAEIQRNRQALANSQAKLAAIGRSMAMIEFAPDGTILDANERFCQAMGYSADELRGKHHRLFCEPDYAKSAEYQQLWRELGQGKAISVRSSASTRRVARSGWKPATCPCWTSTGKSPA